LGYTVRVSRTIISFTIACASVGAILAVAGEHGPVGPGGNRAPEAPAPPSLYPSCTAIAGKAWASQEPKGFPAGTWQIRLEVYA